MSELSSINMQQMHFSQCSFINSRFVAPITHELSVADKLDKLAGKVPLVDDNRVVAGKGSFNPLTSRYLYYQPT